MRTVLLRCCVGWLAEWEGAIGSVPQMEGVGVEEEGEVDLRT